jgi:hypothetical protein
MRKVLVIDTSILCVWLDVPGKETCGPNHDCWDKQRVTDKIRQEEAAKTTFVLPLASIIETGNHIAQIKGYSPLKYAQSFAELMHKTAEEQTPWAAFAQQSELWSADKLKNLANNWPPLAAQKLSLGDATIKDVAEYYTKMNYQVEILTGDQGLKSYEPAQIDLPRRRQRR